MTLSQLITFLLSHLEVVVIALAVLGAGVNFISGTAKSLREAQKRAEQDAELRRRGALAQLEAREADPNTQSYDGYLRRTNQNPAPLAPQPRPAPTMQSRPTPPASGGNNPQELKDLQAEIFQALGMKGASSSGQANAQADLRRAMDQKMGRATAQPTPPRSVPPRPTPRPAARADSKPIESQIEIYLENSRPERLEGDTVPDSMGYSARQGRMTLPQAAPAVTDPNATGGTSLGGVVHVTRPDAINEVRGIGVARTGSLVGRLVDPRNAAQGVIWSEILGKPRSRR